MLAEGEVFDRYRVATLLGYGSSSKVYRAFDTEDRRFIALKLLDEAPSPADTKRMLEHARKAKGFAHPNVAKVHDAGSSRGLPFLALEVVEAEPLSKLPAHTSVAEKLRLLVEIAGALGAMHDAGLVHGHVKPGNVLVGKQGTRLIGFGFGFGATEKAAANTNKSTFVVPSGNTAAGVESGRGRYDAPELIRGEPSDARADQFAWGLLAYELLAGVNPRQASWEAWTDWFAPPLTGDGIPPVVAAVVGRALSTRAQARFASMEDLLAELAAGETHDPADPKHSGNMTTMKVLTPEDLARLAAGAGKKPAAASPVPPPAPTSRGSAPASAPSSKPSAPSSKPAGDVAPTARSRGVRETRAWEDASAGGDAPKAPSIAVGATFIAAALADLDAAFPRGFRHALAIVAAEGPAHLVVDEAGKGLAPVETSPAFTKAAAKLVADDRSSKRPWQRLSLRITAKAGAPDVAFEVA